MNARMLRTLFLTIGLVSLGELLILHWAVLVQRGSGLSPGQALLGGVVIVTLNALVFPRVRRRIRARGLARALIRTWILGSIAALFTGVLLAAVFLVLGGASNLFGGVEAVDTAVVWLGGAVVALGFGSVAWGASVGNYRVRVDRVSLPLRGATEPIEALRIAHVSDLHIGPLLRAKRLRGFVRTPMRGPSPVPPIIPPPCRASRADRARPLQDIRVRVLPVETAELRLAQAAGKAAGRRERRFHRPQVWGARDRGWRRQQ